MVVPVFLPKYRHGVVAGPRRDVMVFHVEYCLAFWTWGLLAVHNIIVVVFVTHTRMDPHCTVTTTS
jgi:hypothetical protein